MRFSEALEKMCIEITFGIVRDNWPYYLKYCRDGYLTLCDHCGELSPYAISEYDFNYEWKLKEDLIK